jgi:Zinc-finger of C2H2 type
MMTTLVDSKPLAKPTRTRRKEILQPSPDAVPCSLCNKRFADPDTFDAHMRTEMNRHQTSNRFLRMPQLEKCYSEEALYAMAWRQNRHTKVWTSPPMPKMRAHKVNLDDAYQCLFCKKLFKDATPFKAHFVNTFSEIERCLDTEELKALDYEQGANGVWRATIVTQLMPSQAARLPTVRQEYTAWQAMESVKHELREIAS